MKNLSVRAYTGLIIVCAFEVIGNTFTFVLGFFPRSDSIFLQCVRFFLIANCTFFAFYFYKQRKKSKISENEIPTDEK